MASGLRWLAVMLLAAIPWAGRARSARLAARHGDGLAWPNGAADRSDLGHGALVPSRQAGADPLRRLRPAIPAGPDRCRWHRWLLVREGAGECGPQGFLCTDPDTDPLDVLRWFVRRWSIEVTFAEVRRHLGVETQRPYRPAVAGRFPAGPDRQLGCRWSELAIARTTPVLLGLFSLVTLWAEAGLDGDGLLQRAAWYPKRQPSFSDALAAVRHRLWTAATFSTSPDHGKVAQIPRELLAPLAQAACFPA